MHTEVAELFTFWIQVKFCHLFKRKQQKKQYSDKLESTDSNRLLKYSQYSVLIALKQKLKTTSFNTFIDNFAEMKKFRQNTLN